MPNAKWTKIGTVMTKKGKSGKYVVLGDENNKNEQYRTTVEIRVKDASGKVVAQTKNGYLQITDPRNRKGITEEQAEKIPSFVEAELFFVEND